MAQRGGAQEEGDDQADDGREERDAEGDAVVDLCENSWGGYQENMKLNIVMRVGCWLSSRNKHSLI